MTLPDISNDPIVESAVIDALAEDIGSGDVTSQALVAEDRTAAAQIVARGRTTVAGSAVAAAAFRHVDSRIRCEIRIADGREAAPNETLLRVAGPARGILTAERTALNFMQRLCGIATMTRRFVDRVAPYGTTILDTRKTTPGLRSLEKYAVLCGGGSNHRFGLFDRVLIKDNHRRLWTLEGGSLAQAVLTSRQRFPGVPIEVEVESLDELRDVLAASPDWVLLDNMTPELMAGAVALCKGKVRTEASGGINMQNVVEVARTGVDAISLGCLTHSVPSADLSLEVE